MPTMMTFLLVGFVLSGVLLEGGARAWSIIYMRDSFVAPDWLDSLALSAFLAAMASSMIVLAAPAVLGSVATLYGIRMTFAVLVPATILSFALA